METRLRTARCGSPETRREKRRAGAAYETPELEQETAMRAFTMTTYVRCGRTREIIPYLPVRTEVSLVERRVIVATKSNRDAISIIRVRNGANREFDDTDNFAARRVVPSTRSATYLEGDNRARNFQDGASDRKAIKIAYIIT